MVKQKANGYVYDQLGYPNPHIGKIGLGRSLSTRA